MGLNVFRLVHPRLFVVGVLVIMGFGIMASSAAAQDSTPVDELPDTGLQVSTPVAELPDTGMQAATPVDELPDTGLQVATPVDELPDTGLQASTPVDQLPSTGDGPGQGSDGTWIIATASIALVLAAGVIGYQAYLRPRP